MLSPSAKRRILAIAAALLFMGFLGYFSYVCDSDSHILFDLPDDMPNLVIVVDDAPLRYNLVRGAIISLTAFIGINVYIFCAKRYRYVKILGGLFLITFSLVFEFGIYLPMIILNGGREPALALLVFSPFFFITITIIVVGIWMITGIPLCWRDVRNFIDDCFLSDR